MPRKKKKKKDVCFSLCAQPAPRVASRGREKLSTGVDRLFACVCVAANTHTHSLSLRWERLYFRCLGGLAAAWSWETAMLARCSAPSGNSSSSAAPSARLPRARLRFQSGRLVKITPAFSPSTSSMRSLVTTPTSSPALP